ncbi:hypothetical protein SAMD00024442_30_11 [Candidatus Symbiothrix dinenymphae]|nr:hypothetical protein SAMD00024442_30_11 [Candidatus Symbiothrix dinenymphae]
MNKRIEIYSLIAGIVFLISGIAKALSADSFANLIAQYGFESLQFLAPLIVLAEVALGLMLVFRIGLKHTALISTALVAGFTLIFAYGLIFNGIEDCGCFGKIAVLNTSPVFTFIRNAVLIYLLLAVWRKSESSWQMSQWTVCLLVVVMVAVAFMSGYTYHSGGKMRKAKYSFKALNGNVLDEFITTSKDSTYLVFAFTYSCPHCLNSIENLKQYEASGTVDRVIGIAAKDSVKEQKFRAIFNPNFPVNNYPAKTLSRLTKSFPTAYYIRNDSIIAELSGVLPCSYVFAKTLHLPASALPL